ncbi:MAG: hypothetical protein Tsb0014_22330 [Pleurocapsa sp.]
MSTENAIEFLAEVAENASLQEKLKATKNSDELIALAKEQGYEVSAEDFQAIKEIADSNEELSEDELETVAGGRITYDHDDPSQDARRFMQKIKPIARIFGF